MKPTRMPLAFVGLLLVSCSSARDDHRDGDPGGAAGDSRPLTVLAAASLTEAYQSMEKPFEQAHPGVDVKFDFQGSSTLSQQIRQGRQAGVFASANEAQMRKVVEADLTAGKPKTFATNRLTIAVPPDNPGGITSLSDLSDPELDLVVCAPQVPCGAATKKVEESAGVTLRPDSEEQDVKDVLSKVQSGEADAGMVYVTDTATADPEVTSIDFDSSATAINSYPIAVLTDAADAELAGSFRQFVLGEQGQKALGEVGFGSP